MYVIIVNIAALAAIALAPGPQASDRSQTSRESPDATVAADQKPITNLDSWLQQIRHGTAAERRAAAANPPTDAKSTVIVEALIDATDNVHLNIRTAAIFSLGDLGDMEVVPFLHGKLASRAPEVRSAAIWALASLGSIDSEPQVRDFLNDGNYKVRIAAAWYYAKIAIPQGRTPLLASLEDDNAKVRTAAVWGLSSTGVDGHIDMVRTKLRDPNWAVRSAAARALGRAGDRKSANALKRALSDGESSVRIAAAAALTELDEASGPIADKLISGKTVEWEQIETMLGDNAAPFLIALLQSFEPDVRANSAKALGESGDQRAEPALRQYSKSPVFSDRLAATHALATLNDWSLPVRYFATTWAAITAYSGLILVGIVILGTVLGLYIRLNFV